MSKKMALEERIRPQPSSSDPKEQAIRQLLVEELSTDFAKREIDRLRTEQLRFIADSINGFTVGGRQGVHPRYESLLQRLAPTISIKSGKEYLKELPASGFIVATNHLALPKATRFFRTDLAKALANPQSLENLSEEIEPFPIRHAAIAITIGQQFHPHEVAIELPTPYGDVQRASGVIAIPDKLGGRFRYMEDQTLGLFLAEKYSYVITYPESGTTGKRGGGGLYGVGQEEFHTGFLRLAKALGTRLDRLIPVIVIGQAFHPDEGFRTGILKPITVDETTTDNEIKTRMIVLQQELSTLVRQLRYGK